MIETSLKSSSGSAPSSLSNSSSTSQKSAGACPGEPAKSTSSGFSARSSCGLIDPEAQSSASATFDLPEPFGPTTTATPGSSRTSTASGNALRPRSWIARRGRGGGGKGARRRPPRPSPLLGLGHPQDLVARHRPDHVRMVALDVLLDVRDQLVVGLAADGLTARAVDFLGHRSSSSRSGRSYAPASRSSACLAAACSAAFFERPVPTPTSSPSITAAHRNVRSWGGPSTSSTL